MDRLAIDARDRIDKDFYEAITLITDWKKNELGVRLVIENLGSNDELSAAHKARHDNLLKLQKWLNHQWGE